MYTSTCQRLMEMFDHLMDHFDPQSWYPAEFFKEFHDLMVKVGKEYCRRTTICEVCPLERWQS